MIKRLIQVSVILFFVYLGDAILSFWVPGYMEEVFDSPLVMGLILSTSSMVGLLSDLVFPSIFKRTSLYKMLALACITSILFALILLGSNYWPFVLLFIFGMATWGVYYEFLCFGSQQFVADVVPHHLHSSGWAVISVFKSLAYFLGPIIGGYLVLTSNKLPPIFAIIFVVIALVFILFGKFRMNTQIEDQGFSLSEINIFEEMKHWKVLFVHVWPVVIMGIFMGIVDATYWSVGAVLTESLGEINRMGSMFLSLYMLPTLFTGFVLMKLKISSGKKRKAIVLFWMSGILTFFIGLTSSIWLILGLVFVSSIFFSLAWPLLEGVYSDIVSRMGVQRKHMIGLTASTTSIAYIVGPILAGLIAEKTSEQMTFTYLGGMMVIISIFLVFATPKKLKLPQTEIKEWKE